MLARIEKTASGLCTPLLPGHFFRDRKSLVAAARRKLAVTDPEGTWQQDPLKRNLKNKTLAAIQGMGEEIASVLMERFGIKDIAIARGMASAAIEVFSSKFKQIPL
jgi:hypothetical protein